MSIVRFSVNQVVLVNLLFVVFLIAGAVIVTVLPVDVYPDTQLAEAVIETAWPGASSEEVERLVTKKIEDEVGDVRHRERVVSWSLPDVSVIHCKFRDDLKPDEIQAAFDDLRTRLDRVVELPDGCEEPKLTRLTLGEVWPLVQVAVVNEGNADERMIRRITLELKDELGRLDGVSRVQAVATREPEIHILLEQPLLQKYGLTVTDVAAILRAQNRNVPAGTLTTSDNEIAIRSVGEVRNPDELADVCIIRSPTGSHVRLGDLATVTRTFERAYWGARFGGKPCTLLYVSKHEHANSLTVRDRVADFIRDYSRRHDMPGAGIEIVNDSTTIIQSRLGVLKRNLAVGMVCVFCVLWMFVGARNSILAIVGIPFSFLCAFMFMFLIDVSINVVSVFSLVLVSGMIVDDAIVVLENVYRHTQGGTPLREAVIVGTQEVMWPVVCSTLTTVAAFLPLLIMPGVIGKFFAIVPKTVTVALLASLFECLVILPVHYLDWGPRASAAAKPAPGISPIRGSLLAPIGRRLLGVYDRLLGSVLAHRYLGVAVLASLAVFVWQASRTLIVEMFPSDFPTFCIDFNVSPGASLQETDRVATQIASVVDRFRPEAVSRHLTAVGLQFNEDGQRLLRPNIAQMWIDVNTESTHYIDPARIMNNVRGALTAFLDDHPQCPVENLRVWPLRDGPPVGKPVSIRLEHPDYAELRRLADRIEDRLRSFDGVYDVADNLKGGQREFRLILDEARASELGLTFLDVATAVRGANDGLKVGVFKDTENDDDVDIKVKYADPYVRTVEDLKDVELKTPAGGAVKVSQVAHLEFDESYTSRFHWSTNRAVLVTADVDNRTVDAKDVNEAILAEFRPLTAQDERLKIHAGGQFEETNRSFGSIRKSALLAVILMYLILASLFRSYAQPLVVLTAVLFGAMGMVLGLVVCGYPFSVVTAVAMVGLFGVVVNDALILLDFINAERQRGTPLRSALHDACHKRARPILLTTATTVFGLAPMAIGLGGYSKIWSPFAMSMCWGLTMATGLTLVLTPALYLIMEDAKTGAARLWRRRRHEHTAAPTPP